MPPRRSARSFFVLPLVLALLALVVFPVFARAGEIPEYEPEVPIVGNEVVPTHPKNQKGHQDAEPNSKAHASAIQPGNAREPVNQNGVEGQRRRDRQRQRQRRQRPAVASRLTAVNRASRTPAASGNIAEAQGRPAEAKGSNVSESSGGSSSPVVPDPDRGGRPRGDLDRGRALPPETVGQRPDGREPGQGSDGPVSSPNAS